MCTPVANMDELIDRLKVRWSSQGIEIPPGLSEECLEQFERENGVVLPPDVRHFFSRIDGMGRGDIMDDDMITIYDLKYVRSCTEMINEEDRADCQCLSNHYEL